MNISHKTLAYTHLTQHLNYSLMKQVLTELICDVVINRDHPLLQRHSSR
ncbi:MAG: hypothetical protein QW254_04145 [Desulfurococcaceae archaeon]